MQKKKIGAWLVALGAAAMPLASPTCTINPQDLRVVIVGEEKDDDWDFNGLYWSRDGDRIWPFEVWEFDDFWD